MNKYENYREIGLPWLKEIPNHWGINKVKRYSDNKKELNKGNKEKNVLSLTYKGVVKNYIDKPNGLVPKSYETYQKFKKDDLVFKLIDLENIKTSRVGIVNEDGIMSPAYIRLILTDRLFPKYAYYYFYKLYIEEVYNNLGAGVRSTMTVSDLQDMLIPVPSYYEQEQIANYLDWKIREIDKLIELEKQKIVELELLKQNFIDKTIESIDNEYIPFKAVFDLGKGLSITKDNLGKNGVKCINYGEIHSDLRFSFFSFDKKLKGLEKTSGITISSYANLECGNFVFADTSEDIDGCGNFTYLEDSMEKVYAGYHTIVCKLKINAIFKYLAYYFESEKWRKQVKKNVKGVKVYSITQGILKSTKVQIPSEEQQNNIVELLDNYMEIYRKLNACIDNKISELIKLKHSLISEVVTGQLDVRNVKIPERK